MYKKNSKILRTKAKKGCIHVVSKNKSSSKTTKNKSQCGSKLYNKYFCSKHKHIKPKLDLPLGFVFWRNKIIKKNGDLSEDEKWLSEIPYDTRQLVIKNILANHKSAITNLKNGHIKTFDIKYKSRKNKNQFLFVDYRALKPDGKLWGRTIKTPLGMRKGEKRWFDNYMKEYELKKFGDDKGDKERKDMIITREYPGMYYLHIPYTKTIENKPIQESIISIDPGIRTFHTFYDPEGKCGKIGDNLTNHIIRLYEKIDKIQSKITKTNTKNNDLGYKKNKICRQNMRKRCAWLRTKIKNTIRDYHWKTASFYCKNYGHVIIPKLDTDSLKKRIKKDYGLSKGSPMIRRIMALSHNEFINKLLHKSKQYNTNVLIVNEAYTSVTCGNCGIKHEKLGSNKIYKCIHCKRKIDRDINGARNILIKTLSK
ncbi:putative transposase [Moumouvirus australiensis]|uniref:Putative transposase n=1 Tax=Moumouvirus australiensis TaxID=2109587 RepID=A0A2P1EMN1_9VIRU|nr:putative transposase [Moumouvirus australiensis]AVL95110.1 putative transposase [Moumouvirus australiensis]